MSEPHELLSQAMNERRLSLDMNWNQVASAAGISAEALRAIRRGDYKPTELTARRLDAALQWERGTVEAYYPDKRERSPQAEGEGEVEDGEVELDTFKPETPAEKALMALYHARKQEEANQQAIQEQLAELSKKLDEQSRQIEELRAERAQNGSGEPRQSA